MHSRCLRHPESPGSKHLDFSNAPIIPLQPSCAGSPLLGHVNVNVRTAKYIRRHRPICPSRFFLCSVSQGMPHSGNSRRLSVTCHAGTVLTHTRVRYKRQERSRESSMQCTTLHSAGISLPQFQSVELHAALVPAWLAAPSALFTRCRRWSTAARRQPRQARYVFSKACHWQLELCRTCNSHPHESKEG